MIIYVVNDCDGVEQTFDDIGLALEFGRLCGTKVRGKICQNVFI